MKDLVSTLLYASSLNAKLTGESVSEGYVRQIESWGAGHFNIVVMGEVKKGKSAFINALLDTEDLVPVGSNVATSTVFKIRYGESRAYRVYFKEETGLEPLDIPVAAMPDYGTEAGNPGNCKSVEYIEVTCPAELLQGGIVLIDTPGLGGLFREHKRITWKYVPQADAVFFVTDSVESPIGRLELEQLQTVVNITPKVQFVQTKCYSVDSKAREARRKNNLTILSHHLGLETEKIPYFMVDSVLMFEALKYDDPDDLEDSGYPAIRKYICGTLQKERERILAERAIRLSSPALQSLAHEVEARSRTISAATETARAEIGREIASDRESLQAWQNGGKERLKSNFRLGMQGICDLIPKLCGPCDTTGELRRKYEFKVDSAPDVKALATLLEDISSELPDDISRVSQEAVSWIRRKVEDLLDSMQMGMDISGVSYWNTDLSSGLDRITVERMISEFRAKKSAVGSVLAAINGGSTGMRVVMDCGMVAGCLSAGVETVIGSAAAQIVVGIWTGCAALRSKKALELKTGKERTKKAVFDSISHAHSQMVNSLGRLADNISYEVNAAIDAQTRRCDTDLQRRETALLKRGGMSETELSAKRTEVASLSSELNRICGVLSPWVSPA